MFSDEDRAREWIADIIAECDRVAGYVAGMAFEQFAANGLVRDAVERCLLRIAEAATRLGPERLARIGPEAPLHALRGLGNKLRHEYERVNAEIVWRTVENDLPMLRRRCAAALAEG